MSCVWALAALLVMNVSTGPWGPSLCQASVRNIKFICALSSNGKVEGCQELSVLTYEAVLQFSR